MTRSLIIASIVLLCSVVLTCLSVSISSVSLGDHFGFMKWTVSMQVGWAFVVGPLVVYWAARKSPRAERIAWLLFLIVPGVIVPGVILARFARRLAHTPNRGDALCIMFANVGVTLAALSAAVLLIGTVEALLVRRRLRD